MTGLAASRSQRLEWTSDGESELERSVVSVPLDYADPGGRRIEVAVSRLPATGSRRRGVLLALNGGPGGNECLGLEMPNRFAGTLLREVYDLIGFDPRGYGRSTPLMAEVTEKRAPFDSRPPDESFELIAEDMREAEAACERAGGWLREHVTTLNIARDMDAIRAALGEEKINYVGYAYGTYVGAVYGTIAGDRLDRSVLDSSVHPDWPWREQFKSQAPAIRRNVERWARWAGDRARHLGLGRDRDGVVATVEAVAAALAKEPVAGVDRTLLDGAVGNGVALHALWPRVASLVVALRDRAGEVDGEPVARCAWALAGQGLRPGTEAANTTRQGGAGAAAGADGQSPRLRAAVLEAVTCEAPWPDDLDVYFRDMRRFRQRYPYGFGVLRAQPWVGTFRTRPPREPLPRLARRAYPPGVVVQATGDPLNPYEGGVAMAERLGHHLVTVANGGRHEMYIEAGLGDVDDHVTRYLVGGVLPPRGLHCSGATAVAQAGPSASR